MAEDREGVERPTEEELADAEPGDGVFIVPGDG